MSYLKMILLSLLGSASAYTLTPYSDASCKKEIKDYSPAGKFDAGEGIRSDFPAHWYDEASFPDQTVYWKVPELDSNCRVALMTQYAVESYGTLPGDRAPGKVILNVGEPGCYYSSLPVSVEEFQDSNASSMLTLDNSKGATSPGAFAVALVTVRFLGVTMLLFQRGPK